MASHPFTLFGPSAPGAMQGQAVSGNNSAPTLSGTGAVGYGGLKSDSSTAMTGADIQAFQHYFGPNAARDHDGRLFASRTSHDFHEGFKQASPVLTAMVVRQITEADKYPIKYLLPVKEFDGIEMKWDVWTFHNHLAPRQPERSAPRLTTHERDSKSGRMRRFGLAAESEQGYFRNTLEGPQVHLAKIVQITNAFIESACFSVMIAILESADEEAVRAIDYSSNMKVFDFSKQLRNQVKYFGAFNKSIDGAVVTLNYMRRRLSKRGITDPDMCVVPNGTMHMVRKAMAASPPSTQALVRPSPIEGKTGSGVMYQADGVTFFESRGFLDTDKEALDPFFTNTTTSSFNIISSAFCSESGIIVADSDRDNFVTITMKDAMQNCGMFNSNHTLTTIGEKFFKSKYAMVADYIKDVVDDRAEEEKFLGMLDVYAGGSTAAPPPSGRGSVSSATAVEEEEEEEEKGEDAVDTMLEDDGFVTSFVSTGLFGEIGNEASTKAALVAAKPLVSAVYVYLDQTDEDDVPNNKEDARVDDDLKKIAETLPTPLSVNAVGQLATYIDKYKETHPRDGGTEARVSVAGVHIREYLHEKLMLSGDKAKKFGKVANSSFMATVVSSKEFGDAISSLGIERGLLFDVFAACVIVDKARARSNFYRWLAICRYMSSSGHSKFAHHFIQESTRSALRVITDLHAAGIDHSVSIGQLHTDHSFKAYVASIMLTSAPRQGAGVTAAASGVSIDRVGKFLFWCLESGEMPPIGFVLFRFPVREMGHMILMTGGGRAGYMYRGKIDAQNGTNVKTKMMYTHMTGHMKAMVHHEKNIIVQPNVFMSEYAGRNGTTFMSFDESTLNTFRSNGDVRGDIVCCVVKPNFKPKHFFLDITGSVPLLSTATDPTIADYGTSSFYNHLLGWKNTQGGINHTLTDHDNVLRNAGRSSLALQGFQTDVYGKNVIIGSTHEGKNIYPGFESDASGGMIRIASNAGVNAVGVTLN